MVNDPTVYMFCGCACTECRCSVCVLSHVRPQHHDSVSLGSDCLFSKRAKRTGLSDMNRSTGRITPDVWFKLPNLSDNRVLPAQGFKVLKRSCFVAFRVYLRLVFI